MWHTDDVHVVLALGSSPSCLSVPPALLSCSFSTRSCPSQLRVGLPALSVCRLLLILSMQSSLGPGVMYSGRSFLESATG